MIFYSNDKIKNSRQEYPPMTFLQMGSQQCSEGVVEARNVLKGVGVLTQTAVCLQGSVAFSTHCPLVTFQTHISLAEITSYQSLSFPLNWLESFFCATKFFFSAALKCRLIVYVAFCYRLLSKKMLWSLARMTYCTCVFLFG